MGAIIYSKCHKLTIGIFYHQKGYRWATQGMLELWSRRQRKHLLECNKCQQIIALLEYYRKFKDRLGEAAMEGCPVCGRTMLDDFDICEVCGWHEDPLALLRPNLCEGGPNYIPLSIYRDRWKEGVRDKFEIGKCPFDEECSKCRYDAYPIPKK